MNMCHKPFATSTREHASWPLEQQKCSGVLPFASCALMSAPYGMSTLTI